MKYNIGDKVKFLNEKGGGVVSKIINSTMVSIAIDDGFEIPTLIKDLLKIEVTDAYSRKFDENFSTSIVIDDKKAEVNSRESELPKNEVIKGLYFGFTPHNQKTLTTGRVDILLINNTEYEILYSLFLKKSEGFMGVDYGSINPFSKTLIDTIDQTEILAWCEPILHVLFHKDENSIIISPIEKEVKIKPLKFIKEDNYIYSKIVDGKSLIVPIFTIEAQTPEQKELKQIVQNNLLKQDSIITKHKLNEELAEVDLHVHSLVEDESKLTKYEKMQIQIDYFTRCLESAIREHILKVIFIHGVGAGILKYEINKILDEYENVEYYDASLAKYGVGATEVIIHKQKN